MKLHSIVQALVLANQAHTTTNQAFT